MEPPLERIIEDHFLHDLKQTLQEHLIDLANIPDHVTHGNHTHLYQRNFIYHLLSYIDSTRQLYCHTIIHTSLKEDYITTRRKLFKALDDLLFLAKRDYTNQQNTNDLTNQITSLNITKT